MCNRYIAPGSWVTCILRWEDVWKLSLCKHIVTHILMTDTLWKLNLLPTLVPWNQTRSGGLANSGIWTATGSHLRMCSPVVWSLALRSRDPPTSRHVLITCWICHGSPRFNFSVALVNSQLVCLQLGFLTVVVKCSVPSWLSRFVGPEKPLWGVVN